MDIEQLQNERLKAFFGVWYAAERLDYVSDYVRGSEKQKIRNIAKEFFRIESRTFKDVKPDGDMATEILITNEAIDKLIDLIQSKDIEKIQLVLDTLGMQYDVK